MTEADVHYIGSISIDEDLMERADLWPGEKVTVWGVNHRERIETYAIPALRGSGQIKLNGGAAHRFAPGISWSSPPSAALPCLSSRT